MGAQGAGSRRRGWSCAALLAAAAAALAVAPAAPAAMSAAPGVAVQDFATGFPFDPATRIGPVGLTFDAGQLYVTDRHVYRFGPEGGDASQHRLSAEPLGTLATGLTWGNDGRLYAARHELGPGEVVELDPATGAVVRVVAAGLRCPTALATDPVSGDLFFSTVNCGHSIERIADPAGDARVQTYLSHLTADGLTFGPGGDLYVAHDPDRDGKTVSVVEREGAGRRGHRTGLATVDHADGIALGRPVPGGGPSPFLVVNRTDGRITKVDLQAPGAPQTTLAAGGSRGDLVAVGDDGCLYATQTDRVVKVTNSDGSCAAGGSTASSRRLERGLLPTRSASRSRLAKRCPASRRLKVGLRFRQGRLRSAVVFLDTRRVTRVRGHALRRAVRLRGLPARSFTVTIRATTRSGRHVVRRTRYSACGRRVLDRHRR